MIGVVLRSFVYWVFLSIAQFSILTSAFAANYYLDDINGNNTSDGSIASPWRTVSKINSTTLLPGDTVYFRCGGIWHEQIILESSGTDTLPIKITSYGENCDTQKPIIDAGTSINGWQLWGGQIWYADAALEKPQINLIPNGVFSNSSLGWQSWSPDHLESLNQIDGCNESGGCLEAIAHPSENSLFHAVNIPLKEGAEYQLEFDYKTDIPNLSITVLVRRHGGPYEQLGFQQYFTATDAWQSHSAPFIANTSLENARIDFQIPGGSRLFIDNVRLVRITPEYKVINQLFADNESLPLAQHPNPGWSEESQTSPFLRIAEGPNDYDQFTVGSDFNLSPQQKADLPGAGVHIRSIDWYIEDQTVSSFDGNTNIIQLDSSTKYELTTGWGYYFDNKFWMLDRPGEWYYDKVLQRLYVWMPDGGSPEGRIVAGWHDYGLIARNQQNIIIEGISLHHADIGLGLQDTTSVTVSNVTVEDSHAYGIDVRSASAGIISNNIVKRSGRDGIKAESAYDMSILGNSIFDTGVLPPGAPKKSVAAIHSGKNTIIEDNIIQNSNYLGIGIFFPSEQTSTSIVRRNVIENSCLLLDDCAAIYVNKTHSSSLITDNLVLNSLGNPDGVPVNRPTYAKGIYLDDFSEGIQVQRNTIISTDYGFHLHNAWNNSIENNTVYGSRKSQAWMQEDDLAWEGAIHDNQWVGNKFFATGEQPYYKLSSLFNWTDFAFYTDNRYSLIYDETIATESYYPYPNTYSNTIYSFTDWIAANGHEVTATAYSPYKIAPLGNVESMSDNLISNSTFDTGTNAWGRWSRDQDANIVFNESCYQGGCLQFTTGTSSPNALLTSSRFPIFQGRSYLVQFDMHADVADQRFDVIVRKHGDNYKVGGLNKSLSTTTEWQAYSFIFEATDTFDLDTTGYNARLDIQVWPDQTIYLDNVVVEEVSYLSHDVSDDSLILYNKTADTSLVSCSDAGILPERCSQYVYFDDGSQVIWPIQIPSLASSILVWDENPFKDTDLDGVADSVDTCDATQAGSLVDVNGCTFEQRHNTPIIQGIDLTVSALSTPSSDVSAGDTLSVSYSITNQGSEQTTWYPYVGFYLSTDATITTADTFVTMEYAQMDYLAGGETVEGVTSVTIPAGIAPGTYYLGAITDYDNYEPEIDEDNNALAVATPLQVAPVVDLTMATISAPSSANKGEVITVNHTISNQGTMATTTNSYVGIYLSTNSTISTTHDTFLGEIAVSSLAAGDTSDLVSSVTIPANLTAGTYYLGAVADHTQLESEVDEGNNSQTVSLQVLSTVDLTMTAVSTSDTSVTAGEYITVNLSITNQGSSATTVNSYVGIYLSTDAMITTTDEFLTNQPVSSLAAGETLNFVKSVPISSDIASGTYYLGMKADFTDYEPESDEGNNTLVAATQLQVVQAIDLTVSALSTPASSVSPGEAISVSYSITNQGSTPTTWYPYVGLYLSTDATITTADTFVTIDYAQLDYLAGGATANGVTSVMIPANLAVGTYYLGAITDYNNKDPETDESNNALAAATPLQVTP